MNGLTKLVIARAVTILLGLTCALPVGLWGQEVGTVLWEFPSAGSAMEAPALGTDGTLYVTSRSGKLYAIHPPGRERWEFSTGNGGASWPVIDRNGTIYVASGPLFALSPTGRELWRFEGAGLQAPAVAAAGRLGAAVE